ncbi:MAG: tachylectin-related carbohydrate-binding protein [Pseudomonadota bacterium]|nr:tachylectin-related carbohydrate-binding protein [Pseudomonadota bacterium]
MVEATFHGTGIVEATYHGTGGMTPASGGDLMWYRHVGREDGSFRWEGPKKVGTGWGGLTHVFSGGDGIIYAITPFVPASLSTRIGPGFRGNPASGGDLIWARHTGQANGSFNWDGPLKRVGTGWRGLLQVFSGD